MHTRWRLSLFVWVVVSACYSIYPALEEDDSEPRTADRDSENEADSATDAEGDHFTQPGPDAGLEAGTGGDSDSETPLCGNRVLVTGEACDDGNASGGDGCNAECDAMEPRFYCPAPGQPCLPVPENGYCGDGIMDPAAGEACDDGTNDGVYGGEGGVCPLLAPTRPTRKGRVRFYFSGADGDMARIEQAIATLIEE